MCVVQNVNRDAYQHSVRHGIMLQVLLAGDGHGLSDATVLVVCDELCSVCSSWVSAQRHVWVCVSQVLLVLHALVSKCRNCQEVPKKLPAPTCDILLEVQTMCL